MAVYMVIPLADNFELLKAAVEEHFENEDRFPVQANKGFLVHSPKTPNEIANLLGITGSESPSTGSGIVITMTSYYGRASTAMWDWMKSRLERG